MISKRAILFLPLVVAVLAAVFLMLRAPDPQAVLRQAVKHVLSEKTFRVEAKATLVGLSPNSDGAVLTSNATSVDLLVRAAFDRTDPAHPASVATFELQQGLANGQTARVIGETRRKEGKQYVRLSDIAGIQGVEPARVIGRWMYSDRSFSGLLRGSPIEHPLDPSGLETMAMAARSVDLLTVERALPNETVNGRKTFHYAVEMNMEAVSALLLKERELRAGRPITSDDVLAVTAELARWNKPVGEVWVDAKTRRFKQITLGTSLGMDGKSGAAAASLLFSNEGEAVSVETPKAEHLEDVLGPLFGTRLNLSGKRELANNSSLEASASAAAAPGDMSPAKDTDGDGLEDAQESFYGADAWNPDTDADGYLDGLEVEKGMDPVGPGTLFGFGL